MADTRRKNRIPEAVLERARKVSAAPKSAKVTGSANAKEPGTGKPERRAREKIVQALRKLHPMD
ncbi:MAG: hypothetical protein IRZ16_17240 [Myxococcaceae bacterium]|nr:hypothetical protein [Myxococcaceae bacterium]